MLRSMLRGMMPMLYKGAQQENAGVAELAYATGLEPVGFQSLAGSTPVASTTLETPSPSDLGSRGRHFPDSIPSASVEPVRVFLAGFLFSLLLPLSGPFQSHGQIAGICCRNMPVFKLSLNLHL